MNSTYEIVRYEPGLKPQVIELQQHLWSPSAALNAAYLEWKYERNPYVDTPLIYLAMCHGRAVAMRGFFGTRWEGGIPAQQSTALYADDLAIDPEHRNRGLISKMMSAAFEDLAKRDYQFAVNLSPGPITLLSSLAGGWRSVGLMEPMRRRPWRVAVRSARERVIRRLPLPSGELRTALRQWIGSKRRSLADIDVASARRSATGSASICFEDSPRCSAMAELVARTGGVRVRHLRDTDYFRWRFQNPLRRYRFLYWANPNLEGYLVLQDYTTDYANQEVVNIVHWEASSLAVRRELLHAAMRLTADRNLVIWSAGLPGTSTALLGDAGFKLEPMPQSAVQPRDALLVRPIRAAELSGDWLFAGQRLLDLNSWDLRMLYSMHG